MSEEQITIERVLIKDLPDFAREYIKDAKPGTFIPITIQRAESQSKNPLVDLNNVGLLVAMLGDEVVGYFGMLPMKLVYGSKSSTVWYFTGWNVSGKVRGRGVGRQLMKEAISLDQDYILAASKFGRKASSQTGLISLPTLEIYSAKSKPSLALQSIHTDFASFSKNDQHYRARNEY